MLKKVIASATFKPFSEKSTESEGNLSNKPVAKHIKPNAKLDIFANIRTKQTLRTQADIVIDKKQTK